MSSRGRPIGRALEGGRVEGARKKKKRKKKKRRPGQSNAEDEFEAVFGPRSHSSVGDEGRYRLKQIRDNDPQLCELNFSHFRGLGEPQLRLLSQYIANNNRLRVMEFSSLETPLFSELTRSSVEELRVCHNHFGREGIEGMTPFLRNSSKLAYLRISYNSRFDSECFGLLVDALNRGCVRTLIMENCDITDISAIGNCTFPDLKFLDLRGNRISAGLSALEQMETVEELCLDKNNIGLEQCNELTSLLRNANSSLRVLSLQSGKICDGAIKALAGALKCNSTLEELDVGWPSQHLPSLERVLGYIRINERGCLALIRLLSDASSIEDTYNSNHTLITVRLPYSEPNIQAVKLRKRLGKTLEVNKRCRGRSEEAGQIKVIQSHLSSAARKEMCDIQGVGCTSTGSILADIDSYLLPNVLALVGRHLSRDDFFDVLIESAPNLMALVDRKGMLKGLLEKKRAHIDSLYAQIAALTLDTDCLNRRLHLMEFGVEGGPVDDDVENAD